MTLRELYNKFVGKPEIYRIVERDGFFYAQVRKWCSITKKYEKQWSTLDRRSKTSRKWDSEKYYLWSGDDTVWKYGKFKDKMQAYELLAEYLWVEPIIVHSKWTSKPVIVRLNGKLAVRDVEESGSVEDAK